MAQIAYIDHSFHQKTLSSAFLPEVLRRHGHSVDIFWDHGWAGGEEISLRRLGHYDALVLFQATGSFSHLLCDIHKNITFVPMLDGYGITIGQALPRTYWQRFIGVKLLNFSKFLHYIATENALVSQHYQYFPAPAPKLEAAPVGLHGFFWCRRPNDISWNHVRSLIGTTRFDSFHLHLVPDPEQPEPVYPTEDEILRHNITITTGWFADKDELQKLQAKANVFFAPRLEEGIGQAMLEAFSLGQCVVAPDAGTMNEYIVHGANGLLYNHSDLQAISFEKVVSLGQWAREAAIAGYARWLASEQKLVEYILTPSKFCYEQKALLASPPWLEHVRSHPVARICKSALRPFVRFCKHQIQKAR